MGLAVKANYLIVENFSEKIVEKNIESHVLWRAGLLNLFNFQILKVFRHIFFYVRCSFRCAAKKITLGLKRL